MGDYDDRGAFYDDIPFSRYEWRVVLEMEPVTITVEADTAEEAMKIADASYQLKTLPLDTLPKLQSVTARIIGVTDEFGDIMNEVKKEVR